MKHILGIGACMIAIVTIAMVGSIFTDKHEIYECRVWAEDAAKYTGYYITGWQAQQCGHWKIEINAPVK